ncbi:peroxisomal NADH pyrophosphatase NUDT12 [Chaetomidium leptoderma]|uniref:Peroxisomal NADH pyrophosphatase NUDT12 n=1 Tax=Chaetomidium leptoderma TaxID=669021 RepID=A0AAN6ZTZ8_9PEZI|nr:peroxisomal NADH pyrophosphatase NUDT12 [Chaetomidium leptoderma]
MDPVSAGASVLAFVGLAFKSANVIHQVLSAVKDGSQSLGHLVSDIAQLQDILERLSSLEAESIDEGSAKALVSMAKRCADDVGDIESKLRRLRIPPTERRVGKLWKRLVIAVSEKDLAHMQGLVRGHFMMLSVQLGLLQAMQMPASRSQLSEMLEGLKQLKEQVSTLHAKASPVAAAQTDPLTTNTNATSDIQEPPAIDLELEQSISRLVALIGEKESTIPSDDAQQMIADLEALLQSAEREESRTENQHSDHCGKEQNVTGELKLIRSLIASAPTVAVNGTAISMNEPGIMVHQDRKRKTIELSGGNQLALYVNRRTRRRRDVSGQGSNRDFIAKVIFHPAGKKSTVVMSVNRAQLAAGSFLSIPRLAVHNVVSHDSPIFKLAKEGNIQNLLELVRTGQASLHDRDDTGSSLLHHGARHGHLALCKLLIQHGLDVDEIATNGHSSEYG